MAMHDLAESVATATGKVSMTGERESLFSIYPIEFLISFKLCLRWKPRPKSKSWNETCRTMGGKFLLKTFPWMKKKNCEKESFSSDKINWFHEFILFLKSEHRKFRIILSEVTIDLWRNHEIDRNCRNFASSS